MVRFTRKRGAHLCLAARPLATIEHLAVLEAQADAEGLTTCWLSADGHDEMAPLVAKIGRNRGMTRLRDEAGLRRHLRATRSVGVVVQSPYPEHYPEWFWPVIYDERLIYAGYGPPLSTWDHGLYGLETYQRARWITADSETVRGRFIEHGVDPARLVLTGNPLMFELRRRLRTTPPPEGPFTLLWAPHWTSTWFDRPHGYSRWRSCVHAVLEFARARPDARVVFRPHPLLPPALQTAGEEGDPDGVAYLELLGLDNVSRSTATMVDDILRSDALLTDGVSIIAYFSATGRPLAVARDADSPPFNFLGEALCAASETLADRPAIGRWLDGLDRSSPDVRRAALTEELLPTFERSPIAIWNATRLNPPPPSAG